MSGPTAFTVSAIVNVESGRVIARNSDGTGAAEKIGFAELLSAMVASAPTSEPLAADVAWVDNGVVKLSEGIPPTIDSQPEDVFARPGETATFSVTATNANSYQWQVDDGTGFENIPGATSATYTTSTLTESENGNEYRCVVTGLGGTVNSNSAALTVTSYLAETASYESRVNAAGGTLTYDGLELIDGIFEHASDNSLTLLRGYLFGTSVNLPASEREVLELTGDGESLAADADTNDSTITCGLGSLCLEGTTPGEGYLKTNSESLFDNNDWTQLIYYQKPLYDTNDPTTGSFYASQYDAFASGRFWLFGTQSGQFSAQPLGGGTAISHRNIAYSGAAKIEPVAVFLTYDSSTRTLTMYDPRAQETIGTGAMPDDFTDLPTYFGAAQRAGSAAGAPVQNTYLAHLKFDGVLTDGEMDSVWSNFKPLHDELVDIAWIIGNSVTSGSDAAEGGINSALNWPCLFTQEANRNNCLVVRPAAMGGRSLYFFRPSDYTKPAESSYPSDYSPYNADSSVDTWKSWRPSIFVCDENQNTAANSSVNVDYEIDFGTLFDAIVADLEAERPGLKVVAGTQLAVANEGKTYSQIIAEETSVPSVWRKNLRDWSALIRADEGGRYDAVYDLYTEFNLGWTTDGDAADPTNDYPNGNSSLFYDDHQHPNQAGHALMATGYWNAVSEVKTK